MLRRLALLAVALVLTSAAALPAQNAAMTAQCYGTGVHAYFSGDYNRAFELFNAAATSGVADPRVVYFRGLAQLRLGRSDEAKQDFQKASKLETADQERMYNVSRALERIQGGDRLLIEQYRGEARIVAFQKAEEMRKTRYEEQPINDARVAPKPLAPAFGEPPTPGAKTPPTTPTPAPTTPDVAPPADPAKPAPAKPALDTNPFSPDGAKAAMPGAGAAGDDPFAPPKPAPVETPAVGKPKPGTVPAAVPAKKPADDADPFGGAAAAPKTTTKPAGKPAAKPAAAPGAEEDPFAESTPAKPAIPAAKPGKVAPKPAEDEDPFADTGKPAKPATKLPAAKAAAKPAAKPTAPPAEEEDPFADSGTPAKPAAKPAAKAAKPPVAVPSPDEDPFAN
jgi:tetratricopeptide (TPR) repeat protein